MIGNTVDTTQILLAFPERQFPNKAADEAVVHIKLRAPSITFHVVVVQKSLPAGHVVANTGGRRFVVDTLRPGIDRVKIMLLVRCSSLVLNEL